MFALQRASFSCSLGLALIVWGAGSAEAALVFNFSGTVYGVENPASPAGINPFGASVGSTVSGSFAYDPNAVPNTISPTAGFWNLPVTPGGTNWMELSLAGFQLRSTSTMIAQGYRQENPTNSPLLLPSMGGFDFQFEGSNVATLNTASLPTGFTFRNAGFLLAFHSNNPNLSTLPNLPTQFSPTSQWNLEDPFNAQFGVSGAYGFAYVDIINASGTRVNTSLMNFTVASVSVVPEPSAGAVGLWLLGGCFVRRRDFQRG